MSAGLIRQTFSRWNNHEGQRLGAALAFYTLLSAAPFAVFLLLSLSKFFAQQAVEANMISAAQEMIGPRGASLIQELLNSSQRTHHANLASGIALFTLLFGASGAFVELREDLNKIWDAPRKQRGILGVIFQRLFGFVLVFLTGCLLAASMLTTASLSFIAARVRNSFPVPPLLLELGNFIVSGVILTVVFVLVFRFVPDRSLRWHSLWRGAAVSAVLFVIGKALIGLYLSRAAVGSAYGAAGSLIAIAFWIYYSAQIFLLGAEFTFVWSQTPHRIEHPHVPRRAA